VEPAKIHSNSIVANMKALSGAGTHICVCQHKQREPTLAKFAGSPRRSGYKSQPVRCYHEPISIAVGSSLKFLCAEAQLDDGL